MAKKRNVLIVDDEPIMRNSIREALTFAGYAVTVAEDGIRAKEILQKNDYQVVISDIKMPGLNGIELLEYVRKASPDTIVILMTAFGTVETAIEAMKKGAFDYLTKPFSMDAVEVILDKAFYHIDILAENRYLRNSLDEQFDLKHFVGEHEAMKSIFDTIRKVACSKATVLIRGESGTGKELVARAIHSLSQRKHKPFIKVNCAALSSTLLESELFGHEKGSFTGAYQRKIGRFEMADGGTLFLDEISEIDISLQAKLLRVLQERELERVGGGKSIDIDVRIITTTNRDLEKAVQEGLFREDLYYRLNVVPITLPCLKERASDIPLLMDYFLEKYARENNKKIIGFDKSVYDMLQKYSWPGNVRELENAIERAVVLSGGEWLLPEYFDMCQSTLHQFISDEGESDVIVIRRGMTLDEVEKQYILRSLTDCQGNKTHTADQLAISVRTLRNKLDEYRKSGLVNA